MIITMNDLAAIRAEHTDKKIVLTSGTFDLFHAGHVAYLEQVQGFGDIVVVLLSGDARVRARKGPQRPIIPEQDRARILDALKPVDYVIIDPGTMPPDSTDPVHTEILNALSPDCYVTDGPDPRFYGLMDPGQFIILPRSAVDISTTAILERIRRLIASDKG